MRLREELQAAICDAGAIVHFGLPWWLRPFLMRGVIAITLGRRVYVAAEVAAGEMEKVLRHELAHVEQVNRLGLPRFLFRYVVEFARHWRATHSVPRSYRLISFEIEAFAAEEEALDAYNHVQQP